MACTKRVSFDGNDDNDRCIRPTMSEWRWCVEVQVVDCLEQLVQVEPLEHVEQVEVVDHV